MRKILHGWFFRMRSPVIEFLLALDFALLFHPLINAFTAWFGDRAAIEQEDQAYVVWIRLVVALVSFYLIFFFIPLGYGWGHRGWGPWYRRRPYYRRDLRERERGMREQVPPEDIGWGGGAIVLWFVLFISILWLIALIVAV